MLGATKGWVPDELRYAGRENLDPEHAARYDRKEDAGAAEEIAMLAERGIGKESTVVEMGAGTGQFAIEAAAHVEHVTAVDISPVMLSHLEAKVDAMGIENVDCKLAGFLTYIHSQKPADLVYSRFALHHLPVFWQALALTRMASILRPGGILRLWDVVFGFEPAQAPARLESWMEAFAGSNDQNGWTRAELEEHVRDENSTFTWLLEPMLQKAGFTIEDARFSDDQIFARYLCAKD